MCFVFWIRRAVVHLEGFAVTRRSGTPHMVRPEGAAVLRRSGTPHSLATRLSVVTDVPLRFDGFGGLPRRLSHRSAHCTTAKGLSSVGRQR